MLHLAIFRASASYSLPKTGLGSNGKGRLPSPWRNPVNREAEHHRGKPNNLECLQEPPVTCDVLNKHSGYSHVSQPPLISSLSEGLSDRWTAKAAFYNLQASPEHQRASAQIRRSNLLQQSKVTFSALLCLYSLRVVQPTGY